MTMTLNLPYTVVLAVVAMMVHLSANASETVKSLKNNANLMSSSKMCKLASKTLGNATGGR